MLNSLKKQLLELSQDPEEYFHLKVSHCLNSNNSKEISRQLEKFVLFLPEMIDQVHQLRANPALDEKIRRLHYFSLNYLYSPIDFLPDIPYGLFGYLDDAYLIGSVLELSLKNRREHGQIFKQSESAFEKTIKDNLPLVRKVLPHETRMIDRVIDIVFESDQKNFHQLLDRIEKEFSPQHAQI